MSAFRGIAIVKASLKKTKEIKNTRKRKGEKKREGGEERTKMREKESTMKNDCDEKT